MQATSSFNVRQYGATGDGLTKDTLAIQKAIDACNAAGGGQVILPAGKFLSGTIHLKSHVELHLSAGATLLGSGDRADYNADDLFPENGVFTSESVSGAHLVIAYKQENVSITGPGTIDGNSAQFFKPLPADAVASYRFKLNDFPFKDWRPGQMVFFCRCKGVRAHDANLNNAPYWTFFLLGCEDVQIRGLNIENHPATANGDGIDIDCCRNVTLSDCIIRSGDDCITLRANSGLLAEAAQPCENIAVSNCILSTPCNAIRVGVGDGLVRRCSFSNIIVTETSRAISMVSNYASSPRQTYGISHGVTMEDIHFCDFTIDACLPFSVHIGPFARRPAAIRDITFNRFRITASAGSHFVGMEQTPLERIRLSDIQWHITGGTDNCALVEQIPDDFARHGYTGMKGAPALPCVLYGRHLHGAVFENIRVRWDRPGAAWRDGLRIDQSRDVEMNNVKVPPLESANDSSRAHLSGLNS